MPGVVSTWMGDFQHRQCKLVSGGGLMIRAVLWALVPGKGFTLY